MRNYSREQWERIKARNASYDNASDESKADAIENLRIEIMRG